jgi:hypothetical protein
MGARAGKQGQESSEQGVEEARGCEFSAVESAHGLTSALL